MYDCIAFPIIMDRISRLLSTAVAAFISIEQEKNHERLVYDC